MAEGFVGEQRQDFDALLRSLQQERSIAEERLHRKQRLAATFRIFAQHGFGWGLAGHVTARDPEFPDHFWVNPFGVHFGRIRVSDLLLVDHEGRVVEGNKPINKAAFAIHSEIHAARPDAVAAAHTHSMHGKAWSSLGRLLDPITQDACVFFEDHALFAEFNGVVLEDSEGAAICRVMGQKKAVILQNHGLLTVGGSVEEAAWWFLAMDNVAQAQLLAEAAGTPKLIPAETARLTQKQIGRPRSALLSFQSLWEGIVESEPELLS